MAETAPAVQELVAEAPVLIREIKAGYKTTEFWVTIATAAATLLGGMPLPPHYHGIGAVAIGIAYVLSRGIAKRPAPPA